MFYRFLFVFALEYSMANQFLSLALFLMLLAFFVILNGLSGFDESKSRPVMNSIALAFSNKNIEETGALFDDPSDITSIGEGDTLESITGLFNANISGFEASRNRLGTAMHVQTPLVQFEKVINISNIDDEVEIGGAGAFLPTLITLLRSKKKGLPYRMDMVINISESPSVFQKQSPDEFLQKLKRVSKFAKTLEQAGMPKKMISAGIAKGKSGFIDLYFYHYKPFEMPSDLGVDKVKGDD